MIAVRYLDVSLVLAAGIFVALAGLPVIGWAFVAGTWTVARFALDFLDSRLERRGASPSARMGGHFAGMMARVLLVAAAVVAARYVGDRDDGVMGAVLALIAFTVYLGASSVARSTPTANRNAVRP